MRTIKFRAWDKEKKKMYKPIHEAYKGKLFELFVGFRGDLVAHTMSGLEHQSIWPDRFELMQFTGLLDKNGVEIYESDYIDHNGLEYEVVFEDGCWVAKCLTTGPNPDGTESKRSDDFLSNLNEVGEIVGNKYEQHTTL